MTNAFVAVLAALMVAVAVPADAAGALASAQPTAVADGSGLPSSDEDCDREVVRLSGIRLSATPVGISSCRGVRPGARVVVDGAMCTLNFAFSGRDPQGRTHRYMGTAGHCAVPNNVQRVWPNASGPVATDAAGQRIGRFIYAVNGGDQDFGLIRLDHGVGSGVRMCHFGGPTGVNRDITSRTTTLRYYGQGLGVDTALPARTAVAQGMPHRDHVHAQGVASFGDSGAGVISADGRAVGLIITLGVHGGQVGTSGVDVGTVGIARLMPVVHRASGATGLYLRLLTAPVR